MYVGSGDPLYTRLSDYYQPWYLIYRSNLYIVKALKKSTMANFSLYVLEYANSDNVISCEQNWINIINPEYNINPNAGNSKGYKHTDEALEKMHNISIGRTHTDEVKLDYSNFKIEILKYTSIDKVSKLEQYYMDSLAPDYNILQIAGPIGFSRLGLGDALNSPLGFNCIYLSSSNLASSVNVKNYSTNSSADRLRKSTQVVPVKIYRNVDLDKDTTIK